MIFPYIECDTIIQVHDKFRIDASKTFLAKNGVPDLRIDKLEIKPSADDLFITVYSHSGHQPKSDWHLDWEYSTSGDKIITVRATDHNNNTYEKTLNVSCLTAESEGLFSNDEMLKVFEPDILNWVENGRNSFIYVHRKVQKLMLEWFNVQGYTFGGKRITKDVLVKTSDVEYWSAFMALGIIFAGNNTNNDDFFVEKSKNYISKSQYHRDRALLSVNFDQDAEALANYNMNLQIVRINRI